MKVAAGIVAVVFALGALKLWSPGVAGGWASASVMVSAALGVVVIVWIVKIGLRNRQRRQLMATRDSALW